MPTDYDRLDDLIRYAMSRRTVVDGERTAPYRRLTQDPVPMMVAVDPTTMPRRVRVWRYGYRFEATWSTEKELRAAIEDLANQVRSKRRRATHARMATRRSVLTAEQRAALKMLDETIVRLRATYDEMASATNELEAATENLAAIRARLYRARVARRAGWEERDQAIHAALMTGLTVSQIQPHAGIEAVQIYKIRQRLNRI